MNTYAIPSQYGTLFLREEYSSKKRDDLQWYFNDLYKFFLYTLTHQMHTAESVSESSEKRLVGLLEEIVAVKNSLEESR